MSNIGPKGTPRVNAPSALTMIGALILFLLGLVIATVYIELLGRTAYNNTQRADSLLLTERDIYSALLDMETGMRGYLITGNEQFLQPYKDADKRLPTLWTTLVSGIASMQSADSATTQQLEKEADATRQAA